jgi:hypothetical protein
MARNASQSPFGRLSETATVTRMPAKSGLFSGNPGTFRKRPTAWWAREDSNLQPDRYERPALTIELRALAAAATRPPMPALPYNVAPVPTIAGRGGWPGARRDSLHVRERGPARGRKRHTPAGLRLALAPLGHESFGP